MILDDIGVIGCYWMLVDGMGWYWKIVEMLKCREIRNIGSFGTCGIEKWIMVFGNLKLSEFETWETCFLDRLLTK